MTGLNGRIGRLEKQFGSDNQPLCIDDLAPVLQLMNRRKAAIKRGDEAEQIRVSAELKELLGIEADELYAQIERHKNYGKVK